MENCEGCKHWGADDSHGCDEMYDGTYKECRLARTPFDLEKGSAKTSDLPRVRTKRHPRSLMAPFSQGVGEYHTTFLFTAPTFGCVHWDGAA